MSEKQLEHDTKMKKAELKHKAENPEPAPPQIVINGQPGRPTGTKAPQSKKKPGKIGGAYSVTKLKDILVKSSDLNTLVESSLCSKFQLKKLDKNLKNVAESISNTIIANEPFEKWEESVNKYIENPTDTNEEAIREIREIAVEHQITEALAGFLYHSSI